MSPTLIKVGSLFIEIRPREGKHMRAHAHAAYPNLKHPEAEASVALDNLEILESYGFNGPALNVIKALVEKDKETLLKKWNEYHGKKQ